MEKWLIKSAQIQKNFEKFQTVKKYQELDLSEILQKDLKMNNKNIQNSLSKELIRLNDLYKSGALSKDEYEKAKKKVLK